MAKDTPLDEEDQPREEDFDFPCSPSWRGFYAEQAGAQVEPFRPRRQRLWHDTDDAEFLRNLKLGRSLLPQTPPLEPEQTPDELPQFADQLRAVQRDQLRLKRLVADIQRRLAAQNQQQGFKYRGVQLHACSSG